MKTKIKPKLILTNILFGKIEECGLCPTISRVGFYGIILYFLLFNLQDKIKILAYFSSIVVMLELCWCRIDIYKRLLWHFISLIILLSFIFLVLIQTNSYWGKAYAIENSISELVRDAPSGIIVSDKYGIIKDVNINTENITGWKRSELIGQKITRLMEPSKVEGHNKAFVSVIKKIEEDAQPEAVWVFNNRFSHSLNILTKYGYKKPVKLYVVAVSFPKYPNHFDIELYAIIEVD